MNRKEMFRLLFLKTRNVERDLKGLEIAGQIEAASRRAWRPPERRRSR
jgi:hypothetical protein